MSTTRKDPRLESFQARPRFRRLRPGERMDYLMPWGPGVAFPTCWDGSTTRYHDGESKCQSCGRIPSPTSRETWGSIHVVHARGTDALQAICVADRCTRMIMTIYHELTHVHTHPHPVIASFTGTARDQRVTLETYTGRFRPRFTELDACHTMQQLFDLYFRGGFNGDAALMWAGRLDPSDTGQ